MLRVLARLMLAAWLCLGGAVVASGPTYVHAQSDGVPEESAPTDAPPDAPTDAPPAPSGPVLQASDNAPVVCDTGSARFRYVEVRGTGFDAWATQRLVGNVVDGNGLSQMQWGSVWVSPQGGLTLEVNLCADPFRNRPALPAGNYTVTVGPGSGRPIAATSIALSAPPALPAADDATLPPADEPANPTPAAPAPVVAETPPPPPPAVAVPVTAAPTAIPLPTIALPAIGAVPTPGPRTGPGTLAQPFPAGAPGELADGWQLVVTGVTPDAWSGIHQQIPSTIAPASDQRDYMVRVQATYLGQGTGVFSGMRLGLVSGIQTTYDQLHNACGTVPDMVPPNLMTPGGSVRGNVCFTVRASDVDSLVLFDNQSAEADRLYFALK